MLNESTPEVYMPPAVVREKSYVPSMEVYETLYRRSVEDTDAFWREQAVEHIDWIRSFDTVCSADLESGKIEWFQGGLLNVSAQCIDRHLVKRGAKTALLWEGDEPGDVRKITYQELHDEVCRMANVLRSHGIGKGDRVAL